MSSLETIWKCQIAWGQISFLLGVLGNFFTLYATTAHNAIKLDKMSIWIIKNLAVADICNCFLVVLPILLCQYGVITKLQVYGKAFNVALAGYKYVFFVANLFLVNILSLNKLLRCLFPLRNLVPTKRQKVLVTMTTVVFSALPTIWIAYGIKANFMFVLKWPVEIEHENRYFGAAYVGILSYNYVQEMTRVQKILNWGVILILNGLPCLTLVIINTALVVVAVVKANSSVNKSNILTVVVVTVGFLVSILPHFSELILVKTASSSSDEDVRKEITWSVAFLSTWINPFIYLAVNASFRQFTAGFLSF